MSDVTDINIVLIKSQKGKLNACHEAILNDTELIQKQQQQLKQNLKRNTNIKTTTTQHS